MLNRKNMDAGRRNPDSYISYQELKQYSIFRELAKQNDILIIKQVLPMVIRKVSFDVAYQSFTNYPNKMIFILEGNYHSDCVDNQMLNIAQYFKQCENLVKQVKSSRQVKASPFTSLTSRLNGSKIYQKKLFMIETKIYNILRYLFHKKIQCMSHFKNFQKLNFFYRSDFEQVPFGRYIFKKDDNIQCIFYLVKGQVRISNQNQQNIVCNIFQGTFFGINQFQRPKLKRQFNAQSFDNETIVLSINLNMLPQLFGKDQNQIINRILSLPSQAAKIQRQQLQTCEKRQRIQNHQCPYIKAYEFQRRLLKFQQVRNIDRSQASYSKFIQNKSLLFKIKDSSDSMPLKNKQKSSMVIKFPKNQAVKKYYRRLINHGLEDIQIAKKQEKSNRMLRKVKCLLTQRIKNMYNTAKNFYQQRQQMMPKLY